MDYTLKMKKPLLYRRCFLTLRYVRACACVRACVRACVCVCVLWFALVEEFGIFIK